MFVFIDWYIKVLIAILGWGSFLCIVGVSFLLSQNRRHLGWACVGYAIAFLTVRFFFSEFYFQCVPGIAIFLLIVSTVRSRYEERVDGKRWWNW